MSRTLLLADDSITIHKVVNLTFMDQDFDVVAVSNGDEAILRIAEALPDIVLADIHMPGASGYEVCQKAKEQSPRTPVILLAGTFERFDEAAASECGADGHLLKPFDSQELLRMVQEFFGSAAPALEETEPSEISADSTEADGPSPLEMDSISDEIGAAVAASVEAPMPGLDATDGNREPDGALPGEEVRAEATEIEDFPAEVSIADRGATDETPAVHLSEEDVERVARRVVELLGDNVLREIAWDVVPDMAEVVITERLRDLERQVE